MDNNYINLYREYEFMYLDENEMFSGVIDLMLEYDDYINIIDDARIRIIKNDVKLGLAESLNVGVASSIIMYEINNK